MREGASGGHGMKVNTMDTALAGIQKAQDLANKAAESIANPDTVLREDKLIEDIVDLKLAKTIQEANIAVIKTDDEMKKSMIDILA
jgi:hypothetical protein